jgi:hypothetical protein
MLRLDSIRKSEAIVRHIVLASYKNMQGWTNTFSTFSDSHFDETAFEAQLPGERAIACWYFVHLYCVSVQMHK